MTASPTAPHVLVISLKDAHARRRLMAAQLDAPGMPAHTILDAVDGRRLEPSESARIYDDAGARRHGGRSLTAPEIGCAASHLAAYRHMVEHAIPIALVLEDDALLGHQFPLVLPRLLSTMDADKPQVILLSHVGRYSAWGEQRLGKLHRLYRPYAAYGAHAYLITLAGAKALLASLDPIRTVADDWRHFMKSGIVSIRAVVPYPVGTSPAASQSQIGNARFQAESVRSPARLVRKYLWQKLIFQAVVKPALRLKKQESTW